MLMFVNLLYGYVIIKLILINVINEWSSEETVINKIVCTIVPLTDICKRSRIQKYHKDIKDSQEIQ